MTDDREPFREAREAGLRARHEQRLAYAQKLARAAWLDECCEVLHDAYERAAVVHGWETNPAARHKPWDEVPEANQATMRTAVRILLGFIAAKVEGQVHDLDQWPGEFYSDAAHVVRDGEGTSA